MATLRNVSLSLLALVLFSSAAFAAQFPPVAGGSGAAKTGTITGQFLTTAGAPLAEGMVYLFSDAVGPPPSRDKYWRVPDFMDTLDGDGKFTLTVPEGKYYLGATKRLSGKPIGPPQEGDLFAISTDDKGAPRLYTVKAEGRLDLGKMATAIPFHRDVVTHGKGITAVEGLILDADGKPVPDALVFAFVSAAAVGRPLYASDMTGKDGKFILRVNDAGKYFLKVRSVYGGGPPVKGEMIGDYGEKEPVAVTLVKGDRVTGIVIKVRRFPGRGPQGEKDNVKPGGDRQQGR